MSPYRIAVADDHVMFRQGLRRIIESRQPLQVVGEADDGLELLKLLNHVVPDLVVIDITMPRLRGIETIHELRATHPEVKTLVLTMHREMELVTAAISAGASGYLLKQDADRELFLAIDKVREGGIYLSPRLSDDMAEDWRSSYRSSPPPGGKRERLTVREREVLKLTAEGKSCREIAELLSISHRTVEHHRANVMAKLNLKRATDLVRYAISNRYV
jgi:DNA-binding NarL/FixJ family response regulator